MSPYKTKTQFLCEATDAQIDVALDMIEMECSPIPDMVPEYEEWVSMLDRTDHIDQAYFLVNRKYPDWKANINE